MAPTPSRWPSCWCRGRWRWRCSRRRSRGTRFAALNALFSLAPDDRRSMTHFVLIVDDNDELRELLAFAFRRGGFDVATARDGAEGVRIAFEKRPDLVITDIVKIGRAHV